MSKMPYEEWQKMHMEEQGWIAHYVVEDPQSPTGVNIHTHGLKETFGHEDIQIVFPLEPKIATSVLSSAVLLIQNGTHLESGKKYEDVLKSEYQVCFIPAVESGRDVMRMVLPGPDGSIDQDTMPEPYRTQWELGGKQVDSDADCEVPPDQGETE